MKTRADVLNESVSGELIGSFFSVYKDLGFGFLEGPYKHAMVVELSARGLVAEREVPFDIVYRGVNVGTYRCDILVNGSIIAEVKAAQALTEADERQLLNYLKASRIEVGFLFLFGPKPLFRRLIYTNDRK
jgi:GxxExxY protein